MLRQKLQADQLAALKSKDAVRLQVLRYALSQVKNKEIETKTELTDEQTLAVLSRMKKELRESIDAFAKGNRPDLVAEYQTQLDIVSPYLPAELTEEALAGEVSKLLATNRPAYEANPKSIIGICMRELKGKAEPGRIMAAIQKATTK